ncbi:MAG TPA: hypothetical protein DF774_11640 [Rheinheimera sp.]|nr:hypothetical protein [Rheinheimera sp.]
MHTPFLSGASITKHNTIPKVLSSAAKNKAGAASQIRLGENFQAGFSFYATVTTAVVVMAKPTLLSVLKKLRNFVDEWPLV